jgi:RND family efflux transporter MFP subunit
LKLADEDNYSHTGQLDFASSEVDSGTGTARIRGVFANPERTLVSGLFVRVRIPVSQPYEALLVPERALAADQSIKYVYVVGADGTATRRTVELGGQRGDLRIITSGLEVGERVIVKGLQRVRPGQKVDAAVEDSPAVTTHKPVADGLSSKSRSGKSATSAKQSPASANER